MGNVSDDSHNIAEIRIEYAKVEGSEELSGDALYSEDGVNIEADGRFAITLPDEEFNGTYYIRAIDGCKNVSSPVAVEVKIDNTAPQNVSMSYELEKNKGFIKDIANGLSFGLVFKDKITIEVEASDEREKEDGTKIDSGIQKYEYKLVPENTSFEDREWKSETESTIVIPATDYPEGFQGKIFSGILSLAGIIYRHFKKNPGYLLLSGILTVAIPAALGALIALNWETVFVLFHKIVFHNNYWIFDAATDPVITILPDTFFMHCALMILALVVLGSIICLLAYRHAKHKKTHTA